MEQIYSQSSCRTSRNEMNFNEIIDACDNYLHNPTENPLTIPKLWSQGRTVYGGLSAALLFHAIKKQVNPEYQVKNINTNFVGPMLTDEPIEIEVQEVRTGKNVSQWLAFGRQAEKTCTLLQACFVRDRDSKITINNAPPLTLGAPNKKSFIPQIPKVTPKFLKNFDLAILGGGIPFTGRKTDFYQGWFRHKNTEGKMNDVALVGLLDATPPTVLQMLKWPAPASTINWNLEFIHPLPSLDMQDWVAFDDQSVHAKDGYSAVEMHVWDKQGRLLALSRQTIAVFD